MKTRIAFLFAAALLPFLVQRAFPFARSYSWIPGGGSSFYTFTGLVWCSLFAYTCYRSPKGQVKRLLLLSPLLLFAMGGPAYYILLAIGFWIQSLRGVAPP